MIINFLGDSITAGACATENKYCFVSLLANLLNCKVNNYGYGGTRFADQKKKIQPHDFLPFYSRVDSMERDADLVFVFGGTNDYGHGDADFGNLDDSTNETYCGAVHFLCKKLLVNWKPKQIIFILPPYRYNEHISRPEGEKKDNPCLEVYRKAMISIVIKYQIKYFDLRKYWDKPTSNQLEEYYQDGLHPNNKGHELIANILNKYIRDNNLI